MYLPTWAVSAFGVVFFAVAALAGWALRLAGARFQADIQKVKASIEKVDDKVDIIDKRLVRVETLLNGAPSPPMPHTPATGVPSINPPTT
jgi:hypothetical protein